MPPYGNAAHFQPCRHEGVMDITTKYFLPLVNLKNWLAYVIDTPHINNSSFQELKTLPGKAVAKHFPPIQKKDSGPDYNEQFTWLFSSTTASQDGLTRLVLQVYLGSNTLEFSAIRR